MRKGTLFYGWVMAIVLGVTYFLSQSAIMVSAALINPLMGADLGMTATELGLGFTAYFLFYGVSGPLVGLMIQKIGARLSNLIGAVIVIISCLTLFLFVREAVLYTICFVLLGLGLGIVMINIVTCISIWFHGRRGFAMSVTLTFGGFGYFVWPLITEAILNAAGGTANLSAWRAPWLVFVGCGVVILLLSLAFIKESPEAMGEVPDGHASGKKIDTASIKPARVFKATDSLSYSKALRTPAFWIFVIIGSVGFLSYPLCTSLSPLHFTIALDFDRLLVVGAMSAFGLTNLLGKFLSGTIGDYIEPGRLMGLSAGILCISMLLGTFAHNTIMLYAFFIGIGFFYGAVITLLPTALANYFGKDAFATINGTCMMVVGVSSAALPIIGGLVFDITGSYMLIFIVTAVLEGIACILGLFVLRIPKKERQNVPESPLTSGETTLP
jgi:MFS family permease